MKADASAPAKYVGAAQRKWSRQTRPSGCRVDSAMAHAMAALLTRKKAVAAATSGAASRGQLNGGNPPPLSRYTAPAASTVITRQATLTRIRCTGLRCVTLIVDCATAPMPAVNTVVCGPSSSSDAKSITKHTDIVARLDAVGSRSLKADAATVAAASPMNTWKAAGR